MTTMLKLGVHGSVYALGNEAQISRDVARALEAREASKFMRKLQEEDNVARAKAQEKERLKQLQKQEEERIKKKKQALIIALHGLGCEINIKTLNKDQTFITGALKEKGK